MSDEIKELQDQLAAAKREKAQFETKLQEVEQSKKVGEFAAYARSQGVHFADVAAKVADYEGGKNHEDMLEDVLNRFPVFAAKAPEQKTIGGPTPNEGETPIGVTNEPGKPILPIAEPKQPEEESDTVKLARAKAKAQRTRDVFDRIAYVQMKREIQNKERGD